MKKTILGIMVIAMILVAMVFTPVVNAAGVSATPATVKDGDEVTVTVTTSQKVFGMQFHLKYDANTFEYVSNTGGANATINTATSGLIKVSYTEETDKISFTFKAKAEGTAAFEISNGIFFDAGGLTLTSETITTATASVTVEKATTEEPNNNTTNNNTTNNNETKNTTNNTEKPSSLPQAGTNTVVYVIAGIAIIAVAAMLISRKK